MEFCVLWCEVKRQGPCETALICLIHHTSKAAPGYVLGRGAAARERGRVRVSQLKQQVLLIVLASCQGESSPVQSRSRSPRHKANGGHTGKVCSLPLGILNLFIGFFFQRADRTNKTEQHTETKLRFGANKLALRYIHTQRTAASVVSRRVHPSCLGTWPSYHEHQQQQYQQRCCRRSR